MGKKARTNKIASKNLLTLERRFYMVDLRVEIIVVEETPWMVDWKEPQSYKYFV